MDTLRGGALPADWVCRGGHAYLLRVSGDFSLSTILILVTLNHRQVALRVSSGMNGFVIRTEDVLDLLLYLEARVLRSPPSYPWVVESFPCALVYFIRGYPYKTSRGALI